MRLGAGFQVTPYTGSVWGDLEILTNRPTDIL